MCGLWQGQPFAYDGAHYQIEPTEFPTIGNTVQLPRVPIWCVGRGRAGEVDATGAALGRHDPAGDRWRRRRGSPTSIETAATCRAKIDAVGRPTDRSTSSSRVRSPTTRPPPTPRPVRRGGSSRCGTRWASTRPSPPPYDRLGPGPAPSLTDDSRGRHSAGVGSTVVSTTRPVGTSPTSGRRWPIRSPTPSPSSRATARPRGPSSIAAPTASPRRCSPPARVEQDKVAQYLYNAPGVPGVGVRRVQGRPRPGQHELPLHRRRARLPVGQRRRRRRRVPRHVHRADRGDPRRGAADPHAGCGSTTAAGRARTGPSPTRRPPRPAPTSHVAGAVGPLAATTSCCSTPAARPACPRA